MSQAGANFDEKAAHVAAFIRHIEAVAEARKEESRRLRDLAAQAENRASALRRYLTNEMLRTSRTKIEGVHAKLSVRKKPPKLILHCAPEELPDQFVRVTCEPCLTEIRKVLKEQPELPSYAFAYRTLNLLPKGTSLQLRLFICPSGKAGGRGQKVGISVEAKT